MKKILKFLNMKEEYIPIGFDCLPTHNLKRKGLRKSAYPFDWQVTSIKSFYNVCKNNFEGLLDEMWIGEQIHRWYYVDSDTSCNPRTQRSRDYIYPVICKKYNILFPHYFHRHDKEFVDSVKLKMNTRIVNFQNKISDNNINKELIYSFGEPNEWQQKCFDESGLQSDFSNETNEKYFIKSKNLFENKNVKFVSLSNLMENIKNDKS
tara:strand:- start:12075 stop:12695 length:621 start_codon:yes stop_codon:yes gene_type:complete